MDANGSQPGQKGGRARRGGSPLERKNEKRELGGGANGHENHSNPKESKERKNTIHLKKRKGGWEDSNPSTINPSVTWVGRKRSARNKTKKKRKKNEKKRNLGIAKRPPVKRNPGEKGISEGVVDNDQPSTVTENTLRNGLDGDRTRDKKGGSKRHDSWG